MKKIILLASLLLSSNYYVFSQTGWFWQNPLPQGNDLNCVKFLDNNTGWAVGKKGTIIKTIDGGNNWVTQQSTTINDLTKLWIIDAQIFLSIGTFGSIVRTSNGGLNWTLTQLPGVNLNLSSIVFVNAFTGWIVGYDHVTTNGYIYKTSNKGDTWTLNFTSPPNHRFTAAYFLNESTGWAFSTYLYKTTNSGVNWSIANALPWAADFHYKDVLNGIVIGYYYSSWNYNGLIGRTTNGGANYYYIITIYDTAVYSVHVLDSNTGYVAGQKGRIMRTTNYGNNWYSIPTGFTRDLNSIHFKDHENGFAVGKAGTIVNSSNFGLNWFMRTKGITYRNFSDCFFLNPATGLVCGANCIIKTTNGGNNWVLKWDSSGINWRSLSMINNSTAWVLGNSDLIYKTTDSGENWNFSSDIETFPYRRFANSIYFVDQNTGFLAGYYNWGPPSSEIDGMIFKSTNGGANWSTMIFSNNKGFNDIKFINNDTGFLVGDQNAILRTTNRGIDWMPIFVNNHPNFSFTRIEFVNSITGWAIGTISDNSYSVVYKSTNSGFSWQSQFTFQNERLSSVHCLDANNVWVASEKARLYASSNGGINWFYQVVPNAYALRSVFFVSSAEGWAVGDSGIIIKTNSGVIPNVLDPISHVIPQSFSLHQNYPNPFNPVTKIKFDLPKSSNTKIMIYDVLGKLVATLLNENLKPGSYEIEWDGSLFASGVYFYSLVTDEYVETKRMVLLK